MKREQTAVEWYSEQLAKIGVTEELIGHLTKEAKAMEKEQIVKSSAIAFEDMFGYDGTNYGLKYYNETYGKDEDKAENND
jgi:hypothetical protein